MVEAQHTDVSVSVSTFSKNFFNQGSSRMIELPLPSELMPRLANTPAQAATMRSRLAEFIGEVASRAYSTDGSATAATLGSLLYTRSYKPLFDRLDWPCDCKPATLAAVQKGHHDPPETNTESFVVYTDDLLSTLGPITPDTDWAKGGRERMILDGLESIVGGSLQDPKQICEFYACLHSLDRP
jgi:hypothetical protein